jgi:hypothetical protein
MTHPEFNHANAIKRGKFVLDVVTNVIQLPDGNLVSLTEREALVFAVHNPTDSSLHAGQLANRATGILFELYKTNPNRRYEFPSISAEQIHSTKGYLKREKLPGWPG